MDSHKPPKMKESRLSLRISLRRLNKLRLYAVDKDKTITQLVEDWIDSLPDTKIGNSSSTNIPD